MKILVLASGGDAPGTNRFLWEIFRKFKDNLFFAQGGFRGLVDGQIYPISDVIDSGYRNCAGAVIKSSRFPKFQEDDVFKKGVQNAKKFDVLIVLGGNGSCCAAKKLAENGVDCIFVPTTIDNDVEGSTYSIGFDTAVNEGVYAVEHSLPSMEAMGRSCLFEVMGRFHSAIAKEVGRRVDADFVVTDKVEIEKLTKIVSDKYISWQSACIIVRENLENIDKIAKRINDKLGAEIVKTHIVGRTQRGGKPTKKELLMARKFAYKTIECVSNKLTNLRILCDENEKIYVENF